MISLYLNHYRITLYTWLQINIKRTVFIQYVCTYIYNLCVVTAVQFSKALYVVRFSGKKHFMTCYF